MSKLYAKQARRNEMKICVDEQSFRYFKPINIKRMDKK